MKRIAARLAYGVILAAFMLALPLAVMSAPLDDEAFVRVAEKVGPSVVTISARISREFTSRSQKLFEESSGSGFLVDAEGYVVTNRHVVNEAKNLAVKLADGREFEALLVNIHPTMDTALLKIKNPPTMSPINSTATISA